MTRYVSQRDEYSCGPVAIINALKWLGRKISGADLPELRRLCETNKDDGTNIPNMISSLRSLGVDICVRYEVTAEEIDDALRAGHSIIVVGYAFGKGEDEGHWFLIDRGTDKSFWVVNYYHGSTRNMIRRKTLMRDLRKKGDGKYKPTAIIVKR